MDQRKELSESELRRVVQSYPAPHAPAFLTERVMARVRREQQRQIRRQARLLLLVTGVAVLLMLGVGAGLLMWLRESAASLSFFERVLLMFLPMGALLCDLHQRLLHRLNSSKNSEF